MSVVFSLVLLLIITLCVKVSTSAVRTDTYRGQVCGGKPPDVYVTGPVLNAVRNKLHCLALCQQQPACTSVTFISNTCSLFTSYGTPCGSRSSLPAGGTGQPMILEKISSTWCSHGGKHHNSNSSCSCAAGYREQFCQIGKTQGKGKTAKVLFCQINVKCNTGLFSCALYAIK